MEQDGAGWDVMLYKILAWLGLGCAGLIQKTPISSLDRTINKPDPAHY